GRSWARLELGSVGAGLSWSSLDLSEGRRLYSCEYGTLGLANCSKSTFFPSAINGLILSGTSQTLTFMAARMWFLEFTQKATNSRLSRSPRMTTLSSEPVA